MAFGDFCQVLEWDPNNTLKPRTVTVIALLPTGNGPVKFASLSTGKTITRENFKVIRNVPYEFIAILMSMQERNVLGIEELLKPGTQASEDEQTLNAEMVENELPPLVYNPADQGAQRGATDGANGGVVEMSESESEEEDEDDEQIEIEEKVLVVEAAPIDILYMTICDAFSIYPKDIVEEAIMKELQNMIDMKVFGMVTDGTDVPSKMLIPSKFFLKDKGSGGEAILKGRFVGGGHRQHEEI